MFQYAFGRKLIEIDEKDVVFDISFFEGNKNEKDTSRSFLLNKFNIDSSIKFGNNKRCFLKNNFEKMISKITGNHGYYQNERYFKDIENIIRKEFTLKNSLSESAEKIYSDIKNKPDSVSVHIRRGDYISDPSANANHGTCSVEYYENALSIIRKKVKSPTFFIFSDDISWVKENLKIENAIYVSNPEIKDYEELILMSKCKHNIIANSSFSWWGAWLNQNSNKIVIGPKQWLTHKTSNELDILPAEWIQI